jgi:spore coat polysaccharide biosynthesis predicted glycosyltransferase SpsG
MFEPQRPVILFRTRAGADVDYVRRCHALAAAAPWADARFLVGGDESAVVELGEQRFAATRVDGIDGTVAAARGAAALVVDTESVNRNDLPALLADGRVLVVIDDSGRFPIAGDLVVNAGTDLRAPAQDAGRYLLGPAFALLRPEFAESPARAWPGSVERALLLLGAAPPTGLLGLLAAAARSALPDAELDVVVGPFADMLMIRRALRSVMGINVHVAPRDIRGLMLAADVAVSAGGVTLLELAATAAPCVGVCLRSNERANLVGLESAKALMFAGAVEDVRLAAGVRHALTALREDVERRRTLGTHARRLVDGGGAARVARAMEALIRTAGKTA